MVRLPHDVFRYILSFKDPRYEKVRGSFPYKAALTRVFFTWEEAAIIVHRLPYSLRLAAEFDKKPILHKGPAVFVLDYQCGDHEYLKHFGSADLDGNDDCDTVGFARMLSRCLSTR